MPASLYVVAHPNDELLFMNPDLESDIKVGRPVTTIYLTSADGGKPDSNWQDHEKSGMAAHATMAGVANSWSCAVVMYGGKPANRCALAKRPVSVIMLRVLDGSVPGVYSTGTIGTVDNSTTYTRVELMATLAAIQTQIAPAVVGAMDGTMAHGSDHTDHVAAGILMLDVARADGGIRQVSMYRAYNMFEPSFATPPIPVAEAPNLTEEQHQEKLRIIKIFQAPPLDASIDEWCKRQYPIRMKSIESVPLHASDGRCLQGPATADSSAVTVAACDGSPAQKWIGDLTNRIVATDGRCLVGGDDGNAVVVKPCNVASSAQWWTFLTDGQVHGDGQTCLTVTDNSKVLTTNCATDMSQPQFTPPATQHWSL